MPSAPPAPAPSANPGDHPARSIKARYPLPARQVRLHREPGRRTDSPMTNRPAPTRFPQDRKCQKHTIPFPIMFNAPVRLTPCRTTTYQARHGISPSRTALPHPAPETHLKPNQSHFPPPISHRISWARRANPDLPMEDRSCGRVRIATPATSSRAVLRSLVQCRPGRFQATTRGSTDRIATSGNSFVALLTDLCGPGQSPPRALGPPDAPRPVTIRCEKSMRRDTCPAEQ